MNWKNKIGFLFQNEIKQNKTKNKKQKQKQKQKTKNKKNKNKCCKRVNNL